MSCLPGGVAWGPGARGSFRLGPSLCPPWAANIAGVIGDAQVMGGAAPILLRVVVACCPRAWPVRRACALVRVRPPVATPAGAGSGGRGGARGAGARGVLVQLLPPPGRHVPFWGRGDAPSASGVVGGRRPRVPQAWGGVGGRGEGGAAPLFPTPLPWGVAGGPRPCPPSAPAHPPWAYTFSRGYGAVVGTGRGPVGRRWVSVGGGVGEVSSLRSAPPPSPGGRQGGLLCLRIAGCRRSVAAHGAGAEPPAGSGLCGSERAVDRGRLARGCARRGCGVPPLGAAATPGGCGAAVSPAGLWPPTGWGGGERGGGGVGGRGGSPQSPPGPMAPPTDGRGGGGLAVPVPGGQPPTGGAHSSPASLYPLGAGPSCRPSLGPPALLAVAARCRLAGEGGNKCWGGRFGSAVSG